jgi:hypothetical protein
MTTLAHTEPARASHLRAHLGTYLIGVGATAAMIAGVVVAFLSIAAFVAFNGLPFGGSSADSGAAYLAPGVGAVPRSAAVPLGAARAAVAEDPVRRSRAESSATTANAASARGVGGGRSGSGAAGGGPSGGDDATVTPPDVPPAPDVSVPPLPDVPSVPPPSSGPVTNVVDDVDGVAGTDLGGATGGATEAVDGAVTGTVNNVGGAVGQPQLGDQVGGAVSGVTDQVLGGEGSDGGLVGG